MLLNEIVSTLIKRRRRRSLAVDQAFLLSQYFVADADVNVVDRFFRRQRENVVLKLKLSTTKKREVEDED